MQPLSPALQAAAKLDRALAKAIEDLAPRQGVKAAVVKAVQHVEGSRAMGAPQIRRLSTVLKTALADIQKAADELATGVASDVSAFKDTIAQGNEMRRDIQAAHAELKGTLGLGTNGAEDDIPDTPPLSGGESAS